MNYLIMKNEKNEKLKNIKRFHLIKFEISK